jgi:glycosyltransferase involved in cell wall biosynthesis
MGVGAPRVSVVTPCYKQARFVGETVQSVLGQSISDWELIVAIDGSPDGSAAIARAAACEDPRARILELDRGGVCRARNRGLAAAHPASRYVTFLDADDLLEATMLERLSAWLELHPSAPAVHCLARLVGEDGGPALRATDLEPRYVARCLGVRALGSDEATPFESVLGLAGIIPSLVMIRRSALEQVGTFDEQFGQGFEDTDLMLRLALRGPLGFVPERLVRYRQHLGGSSSVPGRHDQQLRKLHDRWRELRDRTPAEAVQIARAWRFHDRQLTLFRARRAARVRLRAGQPLAALRFLLGAVRIALRSIASSPPS